MMSIDTFLKRKHDIVKCLNWVLTDYKYAMLIPFDDYSTFADFLEEHHMSAGICNYLTCELNNVSAELTVYIKREMSKTFNESFVPGDFFSETLPDFPIHTNISDHYFFPILDNSMQINTVQEVKNIVLLPRIELLQKTIDRLNIELTDFIEKIH
ncbi:hypothetical protein [Flavobacterium sp. CAU 1735]|uniref:hypothetical protein n=1 Tax=Flavobacterium sp. CAU 1735 TaxID=3140361 RepID=UPI0032602666